MSGLVMADRLISGGGFCCPLGGEFSADIAATVMQMQTQSRKKWENRSNSEESGREAGSDFLPTPIRPSQVAFLVLDVDQLNANVLDILQHATM